MRKVLPLLCAGIVTGMFTACVSPAPEADISSPGEMLFNGYVNDDIECYSCHAGNASGTWMGSNLIGIGERKTREEIIAAILAGPGMMPSYEDKLTETELDELADWLISLE